MCTPQECIQILNENMPRIQLEFMVTGLCLFGSVARGDNNESSDVDILVDMPPRIFLMSALKDFLEQILHASVDLIRRHPHISSKFMSQISRDGIILL